ncbi:MAG: Dihydropteroate synthase [Bacteroidetes bacterium ADurb.Bin217]|nr:MAG: Dihydropteroate synthase [Bacteroidetes bacterium ADurb.Bin217]
MKLALTYPCVMGICNITPDSFYDGGKHSTTTKALHHIENMVTQGAAIIDIGAYSSRPGAIDISIDEEFYRLQPIIVEVHKHFPDILISIDTFRSEIVTRVYHTIGNILVNDISGGLLDTAMLPTCGTLNVPYICMHMQGTPQTMHISPQYKNITQEIYTFFETQLIEAQKHGVPSVIIDPGFGFGKTIEHNFELLRTLDTYTSLDVPILVGLSRKSMIYKTLNTTPEQSLPGTIALNTLALSKGASILRVHDVAEAVDVVTLYKKYGACINSDTL